MAITRQMKKTLLTGLTVVAKAKFNKVRWNESRDPRHAFYRLYRYASEEDADNNENAEVFGPILETFYKDDDDLGHGEEFWYRVVDVDKADVEGDLSEPASLEARGVQTADLEARAIEPLNLNAETVSVNSAFAEGPFVLAANSRNTLVECTVTFDQSMPATFTGAFRSPALSAAQQRCLQRSARFS